MELSGLANLSLADLRGRYRQALTSASYVGLLAIGLHLGQTRVWVVCLGLVAAVGLLAGSSTYKRARAIADFATSRIGSAAQGYVELVGRASAGPDELLFSPFSGVACIWFRYWVYAKDRGKSVWLEIDSGASETTFEISDGTGVCRVDPDQAEVVSAERRVTYEDGNKQVEEFLLGGGLIYVLGEFSTVSGAQSVASVSEDVSALLTTWKQDTVRLERRFDLDGNGEVDLQEWEIARRLATYAVEQQHREIRNIGEVNIMRAPRDGRMFLISALPPRELRQRYLRWSFFHLSVALLGLALLVWLTR